MNPVEHLGLIKGIGITFVILGILMVLLLLAAALASPDPREPRIKKKALKKGVSLDDQRDW